MTKNIYLPTDQKFIGDIPFNVALLSTLNNDGEADICPVAAWGLINGSPKLYYVSIAQRSVDDAPPLSQLKPGFPVLPPSQVPKEKPKDPYWRRHTAIDIEQTKEFVLNIPHAGLKGKWIESHLHSRNWEKVDVFAVSGFTKAPAKFVKAPLIAECPINVELKVIQQLSFPTHDMFIGEPLVCHSLVGIETEKGPVGLEYAGAPQLVYGTGGALSIPANNIEAVKQWLPTGKTFTLLYKASRDGFTAKAFHLLCDDKGATVTIFTSSEGFVFGGYTAVPWRSAGFSDSSIADESGESFLFSLKNPRNNQPLKFGLVEKEHAMDSYSDRGPSFGSFDIYCADNSHTNYHSYTGLGRSYSNPTGLDGETVLTGLRNFSASEIEVYQVV